MVGIVKSHGGFLQVESQVGQGTVFRLFFPALLQSPPVSVRSAHPFAEGGRGETVLIIDDDANVRDTFRLLLEKAGYKVATAEDGHAGLAEFASATTKPNRGRGDRHDDARPQRQVVSALRAIVPDVRNIAVSVFAAPTKIRPRSRPCWPSPSTSPNCWVARHRRAMTAASDASFCPISPPAAGSAPFVMAGVLLAARLDALTVSEPLNDPKLTPKRFAALFEDFGFEMDPFDVQDPDELLASRSGDCIDYAVLADYVLKPRGL